MTIRDIHERRVRVLKVTPERRMYARRMADLRAKQAEAQRDARLAFGGLAIAVALFLSYAVAH